MRARAPPSCLRRRHRRRESERRSAPGPIVSLPASAMPSIAEEAEATPNEALVPLRAEGDQRDRGRLGVARQVVAEHGRDAVVPAVVRALPRLGAGASPLRSLRVGRRHPLRRDQDARRRLDEGAGVGSPAPALALVAGSPGSGRPRCATANSSALLAASPSRRRDASAAVVGPSWRPLGSPNPPSAPLPRSTASGGRRVAAEREARRGPWARPRTDPPDSAESRRQTRAGGRRRAGAQRGVARPSPQSCRFMRLSIG